MFLKLLIAASVCALASVVVDGRHVRHNYMHAPPHGVHSKGSLPAMWLTQYVDHFDASNNGTWQQRYFVNDQYFTPGGPVFLMLGGEGTANPIWLTGPTQMVQWAQQYGALMFLIEHRYYGLSQPFDDLSTENLQYLSSEQALGDAAVFHDQMMASYNLPAGTPWISFGGSYSGALSAWLRTKYPHIVVGAVASSAPVQPELDFSQYLNVVTDSLTAMSGDGSCVANIASATTELAAQISTPSGRAALSTQFQTCTPLTDDANDLANFLSSLAGNFEGVVQYNRDNRAFEGAVDTNVTIPVVCGLMNDNTVADVLQRYANVNSLILQTYGESCLDFAYADLIAGLQNTTLAAALSGGRQWTYQTCTEFGYYQTSDSTTQPFGNGFGLSFSVNQCTDIYGPGFTAATLNQGIAWTLANYGGYGLAGTNIVLPNGSIDPWHFLGVLSDLSPTVNAIYITGTAHCADMYPSAATDSPELIAARKMVGQYIAEWIKGASVSAPAKPAARRPRTRGTHPRK